VLKSQEYDSDCVRSIMIELLDDKKSHPNGELVLYIYSDNRVGTPRKYSSGIRISGSPGKTVFHGAVIPTRRCRSNTCTNKSVPQYLEILVNPPRRQVTKCGQIAMCCSPKDLPNP
jgi:hypothetical protein